jgi:hypothetical protein
MSKDNARNTMLKDGNLQQWIRDTYLSASLDPLYAELKEIIKTGKFELPPVLSSAEKEEYATADELRRKEIENTQSLNVKEQIAVRKRMISLYSYLMARISEESKKRIEATSVEAEIDGKPTTVNWTLTSEKQNPIYLILLVKASHGWKKSGIPEIDRKQARRELDACAMGNNTLEAYHRKMLDLHEAAVAAGN